MRYYPGVPFLKILTGFHEIVKGGYAVQHGGVVPVVHVLPDTSIGVHHLPGYVAEHHTEFHHSTPSVFLQKGGFFCCCA